MWQAPRRGNYSTSDYACLHACQLLYSIVITDSIFRYRIGLSIARRLAQDGAKVMVSSRKQANVDRAVQSLRSEPGNLIVEGVVCHVGDPGHRRRLIQEVYSYIIVEVCYFRHRLIECISGSVKVWWS